MKKLLIILAIALFTFPGVAISEEYTVEAVTITEQTVSAGESYTPTGWKFNISNDEGAFSTQFQVSGDGTGTLAYALSNDGTNFFCPTTGKAGEGDIFTGITETSGGGGGTYLNGIVLDDVQVEFAMWVQFYVDETAGGDSITFTGTVAKR